MAFTKEFASVQLMGPEKHKARGKWTGSRQTFEVKKTGAYADILENNRKDRRVSGNL
jgi:hypothetical protein